MKVQSATIDFETEAIDSRPKYPPAPVGVAIRWPDKTSEYLAWGHASKNNCTLAQAREKLVQAWQGAPRFHNGPFDIDVAECHLGIKPPKRFEDSMFLAFLNNPYEEDMELKPLAVRHLQMPATERDELKEWIIANVKAAKRKQSEWGAYIKEAPGDLTGRYAIGDVKRTDLLIDHFLPIIRKRGMLEAYEREIALTPITMEMERSGVRVNVPGLKKCLQVFEKIQADLQHEICKKLKVRPQNGKKDKEGFNIGSPKQLAEALMRAGKLDTVVRTPKGAISTKIDVLKQCCNDPQLLKMMAVRSVCNKYVNSFINPWLEQCAVTHDRILPRFNQVLSKGEEMYGGGGARSGRYSSSRPNMQNISANVEDSQNRETLELMQKWLREEYEYDFIGLRDFIIPDEGACLISVDYNQQELRLLAHFEQDLLMKAYLENPKLDIHTYCQQLIKKAMGIEYPRKHIKITVFGIIYGMGIKSLAKRLECDDDTAKAVYNGLLDALPGVRRLMNDLKRLANKDKPLTTWGGRQYYCEEPKFDKKRGYWRSFEYKMLNYQIQPSAADVTKAGMILVRERVPEARIAIQVHDELVVMAPDRSYGPKVAEAMCDLEFNVPMLAEAKYSEESWARAA